MWPRSARFDVAVTDSHEVVIRVDLWTPGMRVLLAGDLDVVGGTVTASRTATHRRSCDVELIDRDGTLARTFSSRTTVPPVELVVKRGIRYPGGPGDPDGTVELLPLGVFPVSTVKSAGRVRYKLSGADRSRRISRHRYTTPFAFPAGTNYAQAAAALAVSRLPFVSSLVLTSAADTMPQPYVLFEQDDLWAKCQELALAAGCEIYFDQIGRVVVRDVPRTAGAAVDWQYVDGENSILLPETEQTITDEPGYNGVLVVGESSGNDTEVARYLAVDDDPASQTYFYGSFYGPVPEFYTDPAATDETRAELIARARLRRWLGRNDSMALAAIPHPAHDPGDVLRVKWYDRDQVMILDDFDIPLDGDTAATLAVRSQVEPPS